MVYFYRKFEFKLARRVLFKFRANAWRTSKIGHSFYQPHPFIFSYILYNIISNLKSTASEAFSPHETSHRKPSQPKNNLVCQTCRIPSSYLEIVIKTPHSTHWTRHIAVGPILKMSVAGQAMRTQSFQPRLLASSFLPPRLTTFHDESHIAYYGNSTSTRSRDCSVRCMKSSKKLSGTGSRRARVRQQAAAVEASLERLQRNGQLASYNLWLGGAQLSSSSSSSSSSSESDRESDDAENSFFSRAARTASPPPPPPPPTAPQVATISVCQGKSCKKLGAERIEAALQQSTAGMSGIEVTPCKCLGQCKRGPAVAIEMPSGEQIVYVNVNGRNAAKSVLHLAAVGLPSLWLKMNFVFVHSPLHSFFFLLLIYGLFNFLHNNV